MPDPVLILAPGRSYTSIISGMIGQHPQLCGVLELNLNVVDTMGEWWARFRGGQSVNSRGLLRTVAQIVFGEQTEQTVVMAQQWLRQRLNWSTGAIHQTLFESLSPMRPVEKCPAGVNDDRNFVRLVETFPNARFIHLVRHPWGTCNSYIQTDWARYILTKAFPQYCDHSTRPPAIDPQFVWYEMHARILNFVADLPSEQTTRIVGEDFLEDPGRHTRRIAAWLGIREDDAAIEDMMHPERSPFARVGPPNAIGGADMGFLESPELRPFKRKTESLDEPLPWRPDGGGFVPEVKELATYLGYT